MIAVTNVSAQGADRQQGEARPGGDEGTECSVLADFRSEDSSQV